MTTARSHALYRFYDTDGALLYVGITMDPSSRWRGHRQEKPWWTQVGQITLETYPNREAALAAERAAIEREGPRYNVVHNRRPAVLSEFDLSLLALVGDARTSGPWGTQASDMPDYCAHCRADEVHTINEPYRWANGTAEYVCENGHYWTCGWGHRHAGEALENLRATHARSRGPRRPEVHA